MLHRGYLELVKDDHLLKSILSHILSRHAHTEQYLQHFQTIGVLLRGRMEQACSAGGQRQERLMQTRLHIFRQHQREEARWLKSGIFDGTSRAPL